MYVFLIDQSINLQVLMGDVFVPSAVVAAAN